MASCEKTDLEKLSLDGDWFFNQARENPGLRDVPSLWLTLRKKKADRVSGKGSADEVIDYPHCLLHRPSFHLSLCLSLSVCLLICLSRSSLTKRCTLCLPLDVRRPLSADYLFRQAPNSSFCFPFSFSQLAFSVTPFLTYFTTMCSIVFMYTETLNFFPPLPPFSVPLSVCLFSFPLSS